MSGEVLRDFKAVKVEIMLALYRALNDPRGLPAYTVEEIGTLMNWDGGIHYIRKALSSLVNERLVLNRKGAYELSENGILLHEQQLVDFAPASDRLVSIDHNSAEASEIDRSLAAIEDSIRTQNDAFQGESEAKEAALSELSALRGVWQAPAIRLEVFRERAKKLLAWISEKGAATVITELCRHAVKLIMGWP